MCSRAPRRCCVSSLSCWLGLAALAVACGAPDASAPADAMSLESDSKSELGLPAAPAELNEPTEPSDALRPLGGQTGSEIAQGFEECSPLRSEYALSEVTPLGFAAAELIDALAAQRYWLSGLGVEDGPVEVTLGLEMSATFVDRNPEASPELVCIDAVHVDATLSLQVRGEAEPITFGFDLYAAAPDQLFGFVWLDAVLLQGALAEAGLGDDVIVNLENQGDGLRVWFYRRVVNENVLIGRVVPLP